MTAIPCPTLYEMFDAGRVPVAGGAEQTFDLNIPVEYAEALYRVVRSVAPTQSIEVGLACGTSALCILSALRETSPEGRLLSIDPFQSDDWRSAGRLAVERAGLADRHDIVEDFDYLALPNLLRGQTRAQFAYIDGWHTFDYTLVDFFYVDKMLDVGGVVGFNDVGFRAVHRVIRFLLGHRKYEEIDVGLTRRYEGRLPVAGPALKRMQGRSNADRYFRKVAEWEPHTNFYASF